jgi:L-ascorbate metabolism protein UlaG (beta-lactamase superfamily)
VATIRTISIDRSPDRSPDRSSDRSLAPGVADGGATERRAELDRAHRPLLRSTAGLLLSLRFLATALGRLFRGTRPAPCLAIGHPPAGVVAVTFVGHATVMVTTPRLRILTDPMLEGAFFGLRRARAAGLAARDRDDVGLILISHAHRDHLCLASLRALPRHATIVVPPRCADLVTRLGFAGVIELAPGRSFAIDDAVVTAVPVRHSGSRGLGDFARRGASGYVVSAQGTTVYFAGDTGYFSGFAEIGRRFRPDVALLPIGGYEPAPFRDEHMSPLDAAYAFDDLGARVLIPIAHGSFPLSYEPLDAPLSWMRTLAARRGLGDGDSARDGASARRQLAPLEHGETCFFRKRG